MHDTVINTVLIVTSVLLFFALGVALMVIMDHKARLSGGYKRDLFSISGMRRDHPVEAFLTMSILMGIIFSLLLSVFAVATGKLGLFKEKTRPELLVQLSDERMVERMRHFHNVPHNSYVDLGKKNVCFQCHGDYPHSKEPMIRTLMNMHTQFIGCMTCHADPDKIPEKDLSFEWLNFSGIETSGPHFGTDINPKTGYLIDTDDYYSKIVVYSNMNNDKQLLEMPEDRAEVQEFLAIRDKLSSKDKEAIKKRFHKPIMAKGRFCTRCHTTEKESYLPFKQLGFSEQRIYDLTNLNIIGLVQKYKKFYMPNLLSSDKSLPALENLAGPDKAPVAKTGTMKKDPRAWWKEMYDAPGAKPKQ